MSRVVTVNNVDILATYNVIVGDGSYQSLVQWPAMKAVQGNEWQEVDGYEPDLSSPKLESRTVIINFILKGSVEQVDAFYHFLGNTPTATFHFAEINRTLTMRLEAMPSIQYARHFKIMGVRFAADKPLEGYSYLAPSSSLPENREYVIDDVPLSSYGLRILRGTIGSVIKGADVKPLLIRRSSVINGAKYDENPVLNDAQNNFGSGYETVGSSVEGVSGNWKRSTARGTVTYKGRDITLSCLLKTATLSEAWRNYDALLYDLTKVDANASDPTLAGARTILIKALAKTFKCFYKSQQVKEFFYRDGCVWIKFNLTLTLFQEEGSVSFFLSTEDGGFVITEDGKLIELEFTL